MVRPSSDRNIASTEMPGFRRALAAVGIGAAVVVAAPVVHAETRLALNGIRAPGPPLNAIIGGGVTPEEYDAYTPQIGGNWLPGSSPVVVDYPATAGLPWGLDAPTLDESAVTGQGNLHTAITTASEGDDPVVVAGLSEGSIVADRELAYLASHPDEAPPAGDLSFVLMASPSRGVASLLAPGTYIPILGYTTQTIPETKYHVDVVFTEYDGWADLPDRPWNLISVANALMGSGSLHAPTALADQSQAVEVSSTTNSQMGTTTTYMIPTEQLPLTDSLRQAGVPTSVTDGIDDVLRPVVDAGYSRNDTGVLREPYVTQGKLVVPSLGPDLLTFAPSNQKAAMQTKVSPTRAKTSPLTTAPAKPKAFLHRKVGISKKGPLRLRLSDAKRSPNGIESSGDGGDPPNTNRLPSTSSSSSATPRR